MTLTYIKAGIALLLVSVSSCTPPPPLMPGDVQEAVALVLPEESVKDMAGFGEVSLAVDGEEFRGKMDIYRRGVGLFKANFYGPFGIAIGSVSADNEQGAVAFEGETYTFPSSQTMDPLPFSWMRGISVQDLSYMLLGEMPPYISNLLRRRPDSCFEGERTITALWKTDSLDVSAVVRKRKNKVESVAFACKDSPLFRQVMFGDFRQGRALKIEFKENDANYFMVRYKQLRHN